MRTLRQLFALIVLMSVGGGGCHFIKPGSLKAVAPVSDRPNVGNVYLVRGLIGVFSFGMDDLAEKLEARQVRCNVYQDVQAKQLASELRRKYAGTARREPIILIGHSLGADDVIDIAHTLDAANIPVDLLITLDAVNPRRVPKNVRVALNYYKPHALDGIPALRGIPLEPAVPGKVALYNMSLTENRKDLALKNTNHFNIDKNPRVHDEIIARVLEVCRPRSEWVQAQQQQQQQQAGQATAAGAAPARALPNQPPPSPSAFQVVHRPAPGAGSQASATHVQSQREGQGN